MPFDSLKHIDVTEGGAATATMAVDAYVSFRQFDYQFFGVVAGPRPTANTRANVDLALDFAGRLRLYAGLKHGGQYFRGLPAAPIDSDSVDVHQAFVELNFGDVVGGARSDFFVRVGRQELHYGGGRLIAARLGPNVRSDFDGITVRGRRGSIVADAFVMRGVRDGSDAFDNGPDRTNALWGFYATRYGRRANIDLIYVGQHAKDSEYAFTRELLNETRHSLLAIGTTLRQCDKLRSLLFMTGRSRARGRAVTSTFCVDLLHRPASWFFRTRQLPGARSMAKPRSQNLGI